MPLALVTGATGYLGSVVVDQLLDAGYKVRGTARSAKVAHLRSAFADLGAEFEVSVVDDLVTSDLTDAFKGVDVLVHVGSPIPLSGTPAAEILKTAITGTERVLRYALDAGVKKVVVTSSVSALSRDETMWENVTIGEDDWNPQTYEEVSGPHATLYDAYCVSKKLAEQAVWKFAKENPEISVASVLPTAIYGPGGRGQVLTTPAGGTNAFIYTLIQGPRGRPLHDQKPYITSFAHVNDVARAHILALNVAPSAKPNRIIISAGKFTWKEAVDYLAKKRPELKDRLPVVKGTEKVYDTVTYDSSSAAKLIGLTEYISWEETLESTIDDILRREAELGIDTTASS